MLHKIIVNPQIKKLSGTDNSLNDCLLNLKFDDIYLKTIFFYESVGSIHGKISNKFKELQTFKQFTLELKVSNPFFQIHLK